MFWLVRSLVYWIFECKQAPRISHNLKKSKGLCVFGYRAVEVGSSASWGRNNKNWILDILLPKPGKEQVV
jgi:hypothetical protein